MTERASRPRRARPGTYVHVAARGPMSDSVQITVEGTPNPNAAKFVLDRDLPEPASRSFFSKASAEGDPLASRLFAIAGVRALLLVENFITVTKREDHEWPDLVGQVEAAIRAAWEESEEG